MKHMLLLFVLSPLLVVATTLSDGLVAHYKFDGNANDSSGNGNDGFVNGALLTNDRFGNENGAYAFSGADWIRIPDSQSLREVTNSFSISVWVNQTSWYKSGGKDWGSVLNKGDTVSRQYGLQFYNAEDEYNIGLCMDDVNINSSREINLNQWHHWVVTFENGEAKAYCDGSCVGDTTSACKIKPNNAPLLIGKDMHGLTEYFIGAIDDVRIYNRALNDSEVEKLHSVEEKGIVVWLRFDGDAKDCSGYGNSGSVHGATLTADRFGNSQSAYLFSGTDWIQISDSPELRTITNGFSISVWANQTDWYKSGGKNWGAVVNKGDTYCRQYGLQFYNCEDEYNIGLCMEDVNITSSIDIELNKWHHWVVTFGNCEAKAYCDGVCVGETVSFCKIKSNTANMLIGKDLHGLTEYFIGTIDDVRVYNRAISADEVRAIYSEGGDPIVYRTVTFDVNGGTCATESVKVSDRAAVGELPTATRSNYTFLGWFTAAVGGEQVSSETVVTADVTWYAHWQEQVVEPTIYTVQFNANGGSCARTSVEVEDGAVVGTLPTATRDGYNSLGWFTAANGGTQVSANTVVTADATWYAHWQVIEPDVPDVPSVDPGEDDEPMDASIANTYDGVIVDADGLPMGYINVKTAKASGKGDAKASKVTATIQMAGEAKKVTVKANVLVSEATMSQAAADGRILDLTFSRYGIWGTFDGYEIDGVRNLLISTAKSDKGTDAKIAADAIYTALKGNYVMAYQDDNGWNGLSITVMIKGKVRVSGKLANGTSVATTSQLIVGSDYSVIPVIYTKKDTSLAFNIYFSNDGAEAEVFGYYDAVISSVGGLGSGLSFYLGDEVYDLFDESYSLCDQFLPYGLSVEPLNASKWSVANGAKAGSIKLKDGEVVDTKESDNPSGLKLTFNSRAGTFSGSFKVYALDSKNKLKTFTATISGVVIDGIGYGTATIKKIGSCSIVIAE